MTSDDGSSNESSEIVVPVYYDDGRLVSDELEEYIVVTCCIIVITIGGLGILANIANLVVFVKIGFHDTINVSFFALSLSDGISLLAMMWACLCVLPFWADLTVDFIPGEVQHMTGGWPHVLMARYSSWVTVYVTFERFLCVAIPLSVKRFLTPTRVKILLPCLFVVVLASVVPIYMTSALTWQFRPSLNRTVLGLAISPDRDRVAIPANIINFLSPTASFAIVVVFTIGIVARLNQKAKRRQSQKEANANDSSVTRDNKAAKMMVMVSTIFLVCFTPNVFLFVGMVYESEFSIAGKFQNLFLSVFGASYVFESINASVNFFVYYRMSSKFRTTCIGMFVLSREQDQ